MLHNPQPTSQQLINQLVLTGFVCAVLGFIAAMALGAFPGSGEATPQEWRAELKQWAGDLHNWVAIIVSATAAAISGYAVVMVRMTLHETQEMAKEQRRMTDLEFRPMVHTHQHRAFFTKEGIRIMFDATNYGRTPALYVEFRAELTEFDGKPIMARPIVKAALPPDGKSQECELHLPFSADQMGGFLLTIVGNYSSLTGASYALETTEFGAEYKRPIPGLLITLRRSMPTSLYSHIIARR